MAYGYADVPTRLQDQGSLDKAILMSEIADSLTGDRDFNEFVLRVVAGAGNAADAQAVAWAKYVEGLPYRRENGEVYRDWKEIVGFKSNVATGGDCDDLTILVVAGLRSLGLESIVEILKDEQGWGFHVRARVGLPPHSPTYWAVVDPVWRSEREWVMDGQPLQDSPLVRASEQKTQGLRSSFLVVPMPQQTPTWSMWIWLILGATIGWLWKRKS